mgnify:CR=1 FL=1|tara:strand:+ start:1244 stop:1627 length:384 start_codon:yes stop_codon:yes gene_type:complete
MSTLKVNNIQTASGGSNSTPEEIEGGRAKAWCNLNGTGTIAVRDSFGLSSVTDTATAKYQFNFTTAFPNTNYCVLTGQNRKEDGDSDDRFFTKSYNYNTTDFRIEHAFVANDSQNSDSKYVFIAVMA